MRFSPTAALLASFTTLATATSIHANPYIDEVADAVREVACARQEFLQYRRDEFPRQLRQLDAAIDVTRLEIEMLLQRLEEYASADRFRSGRALGVTIDATRLHLVDARQRLKGLEIERVELYRLRRANLQSLLAGVWQAQARVAALADHEMNLSGRERAGGSPSGR